MSLASLFQNRPRIYDWLHRAGLVSPQTQTHPDERQCLRRHATGAKSAVEIGTYMGVTAAEIVPVLASDGTLYCIDPYLGGEAIRRIALRHFRRSGTESRINLLQCTAEEALPRLPPQVDFVFVDGDHSYEGLQRDWAVVKKILRPGGIAAFHDTAVFPGATAISQGAVRCFDELIRPETAFELVETCKSLNVIRRRWE
jgi:predicted O-methyltransferase YrrM